jgi:hypothetical protein
LDHFGDNEAQRDDDGRAHRARRHALAAAVMVIGGLAAVMVHGVPTS